MYIQIQTHKQANMHVHTHASIHTHTHPRICLTIHVYLTSSLNSVDFWENNARPCPFYSPVSRCRQQCELIQEGCGDCLFLRSDSDVSIKIYCICNASGSESYGPQSAAIRTPNYIIQNVYQRKYTVCDCKWMGSCQKTYANSTLSVFKYGF